MPSSITHAYIGLDTLKKLNKKPKQLITNRLGNYQIYCQNMDVLYFYHLLLLKRNKIQQLGHRFHNENVYNIFKMLIDDNKENKDHELFTFIAGLITHYKADSIMHPYINYLSFDVKERKRIDNHFMIETYLDNYFVNKYQTQSYQHLNYGKIFFNYTKEKIIEEEINKIFSLFFHTPKVGIKYYHALKTMKFVYKYIRYDKYGIKRQLYKIIDLNPFKIRRCTYLSYHFTIDQNKYLNKEHCSWFNYDNKEVICNKSFLELYDLVTYESIMIINNLYAYIFENKKVNLRKLLGNYSYANGLLIA